MLATTQDPTVVETVDNGFQRWEDRVLSTFGRLRARCLGGAGEFRGDVQVRSLGSVVLAEVSASHTGSVERTPRLIGPDDPQLYRVGLQVDGHCVIEQDGRSARLHPGDLAVYDAARPYRITFSDDFRMTVAMFPRTLVRLPPQRVSALTAVPVAGDAGAGFLLAQLLHGLSQELHGTGPVIASHLGNALVDLATAAVGQHLAPLGTPTPGSHRELLARVNAYIDEHLGDPELGIQGIARAHFVSVRLLQKLFEGEGTSVSAVIRGRRLERCRRDLADPALADVPISLVGHRWGFTDPAYFSRLFRSTYGLAPREFRKTAA
jgi:AraC-like DNA-binding protein